MKNIEFCSFNADVALADQIASGFNKKLHVVQIDRFADSELQVRLPEGVSVEGKTFFIVHSTSRPVQENIMLLSLLVYRLKQLAAAKIIAVVPYFGYARQCKTIDGKRGAAALIACFIESAGVDEVVVIEPHDEQLAALFSIPFHKVNLSKTIAEHIESHIPNAAGCCVVAPDHGAYERAAHIASYLGVPVVTFGKERYGINKIKIFERKGDCLSDRAIMIDDIIDTGSTALHVAQALRDEGIHSIYGYFIHPVFSDDVLMHLQTGPFEKIFVSPSIAYEKGSLKKVKLFDILEAIVEVLKQVIKKNGY